MRALMEKMIEANNTPDRMAHLISLRQQLENLKPLNYNADNGKERSMRTKANQSRFLGFVR